MTPFSTALQTKMSGSTTQATLPKPKVAVKPLMAMAPKPKFNDAKPNAQVSAYGKAMNQAIKNTKLYR